MKSSTKVPTWHTAAPSFSRDIGIAVAVVFLCTIFVLVGSFLLFSRGGYERAMNYEATRIEKYLSKSLRDPLSRGDTASVKTIANIFCEYNWVSQLYVMDSREQTVFEFHQATGAVPTTVTSVDRILSSDGTMIGEIHLQLHDRALRHRLGEISASIALTGLAILLVTLFALHFIVLRQLSRPLSVLSSQAREYECGNFSGGTHENGEIAIEFRPLAESLKGIGKSLSVNMEKLHRTIDEKEALIQEQFIRMNRSVSLMELLVERERDISHEIPELDRLANRIAVISMIYREFMETLASGRIEMDRLVRAVVRREHQNKAGAISRPLTFDFESFTVPFETAVPLALLFQELTDVLLKEGKGDIRVKLRKMKNASQLSLIDDTAVGLPIESPWADRLAREYKIDLSRDGGFIISIPKDLYD